MAADPSRVRAAARQSASPDERIQKAVGHVFRDPAVLRQSLTHKSLAKEQGSPDHYERMEFLGDSILSSLVADFLYHKYPDEDEGRLSQLKSQLVSCKNLSKWALDLDLGSYLRMSDSEEQTGGRARESTLCDAFEALIAALYLDGGYETARAFIFGFLNLQKRIVSTDSKSRLQELVQSRFHTIPEYRVVAESGPDHDKRFEIGVLIKKKLYGVGAGRSKKDAEQSAARGALKTIGAEK